MPNVVLLNARHLDACRAKSRVLYSSRQPKAWLVGLCMAFASLAPSWAGQVCRPTLKIEDAKLSEMIPPTLERKWTATVQADASRCATAAGYFEVGILRLKEFGPELAFREQFVWSVPSVKIGIDFWADEAVQRYWIDSVQSCPCTR